MERKAKAIWSGNLKDGHGKLTTGSGVLKDSPYSFATRFEKAQGTNPEELIAAAHAGCFTMALSAQLSKAGFTPKSLTTSATVTLKPHGESWEIAISRLRLQADVPGIDEDKFQTIAEDAKANCPVSKLMKAEIELEALLVNGSPEERLVEDAPDNF